MKKLLLILTLLITSIGFAQEQAIYKQVVSEFQNNYNEGNIVSIFNMFNDDFKKVLTLEKTKAFFKEEVNREALGKIKSIDYTDTVRSGHNYIINFENGIYNAYFMVGTDNKLEFFQVNSIKKKK